MLKKPLSILLTLALLLSCVCVFSASADPDPYLIDDFEGYADTAALQGTWATTNGGTSALLTDSGKAMSFGYTAWNDIYRAVDFSTAPADAVGLKLNINSASAVNNVSVKMGYNNGAEYRFVYTMDLKAGDNEILLPFDDAGWTGVAGWGSVGPMKPLSSVKQLMISSGGGTNTLAIDNIRFLKASEISDPYSIADFDGYADKTALEADWESADDASLDLDGTTAKAGKSLKIAYTNYGNTYMKRLADALAAPADAAGIGVWIKSSAATSNLKIRVIYGTDAHRYAIPVTLTEGINEIKLSFDDPAWSRVGGWDAAPAAMPGKTGITAVQFESAGGAYTLNVDDIRFLKESELDGGGDNPPVEVPEEPTLPADPYKLDDFEGYANSASLGYNSLWADNSGGGCTAKLTLETGTGNVHDGTSMKVEASDTGWMTITRNGVTIPADATSMTFWARAEAETSLKLEFRLNNNDYKYAPAAPIAIGTEGALYTVYFEDCSYLPGSGGADKGWIFNEKCLVNAINFMRDGYDALTLYIDDISFGKEAKPVDPNDPVLKLQAAIEELPAADKLTVSNIARIEALYEDYSALSAGDKKRVANRDLLLDAKDLADTWTDILGDDLDTVLKLGEDIAALPAAVTAADKEAVEALWKTYAALNAEQQALVPGREALKAAHEALSGSPQTGAALPAGAGVLALLSAAAFLALRKKKA